MTYDLQCTDPELVDLLVAVNLLREKRGHKADLEALRALEYKIREGMCEMAMGVVA